MGYKDEWLLIEANDDMDEVEHREPSEELLFYRAVANGDTDAVRKNCELNRFTDSTGVGILSRDPVVNLKYHFVVTTAMITRMCRQHGMELVRQHPGIDGVMIGRGVFHDPFCFSVKEPLVTKLAEASAARVSTDADSIETRREAVTDGSVGEEATNLQRARQKELLDLLSYHLDLFDQWQPQLGRPYETLKRFFKIYVRDFAGASEMRASLMETKSTDQARKIIKKAAL